MDVSGARPRADLGAASGRPLVVELGAAAARDATLTGGKASALATAAQVGLPTLPGIVLTTVFSDLVDGGVDVTAVPDVREAFELARGNERDLVARSSSVVEDSAESSMAGRFESVIGIHGLDAFVTAVKTVLDSRIAAGAAGESIAVLVQPLLEPAVGGVMFGIDPVSGRSDRRIISAVRGAPEPLVSGQVEGSRYVLDASGKVLRFEANDGPRLNRGDLRRLLEMSNEVAAVFGGPQDVEWAIGADGQRWLLQSRPVTTETRGAPGGPIYGPGPSPRRFRNR